MSPQRLWIAKVGLESQLCDLCTGIEGESQAIAPSEIPRLRMSFTTSTCARIGNCPGATVSKSGSGNSAFGSRSWSRLSPESGASNQIYQQCNTAQHKHGSQLPLLAAATKNIFSFLPTSPLAVRDSGKVWSRRASSA